jgi:hypothetical protein
MVDITRVAFVACGCLRQFSNCYKSWNIFDEQHNYVLTWDTDYKKTLKGTNQFNPIKVKEYELIDAKRDGYIVDYQIFIEPTDWNYIIKSPFLWAQLSDYISYDYDYVLITRPDIYLGKYELEYIKSHYRPPNKNEVQTMNVNHELESVSDSIFFMRRDTYDEFSNFYEYLVKNGNKPRHIHQHLYDFFKSNDIIYVTNVIKDYIRMSNMYRTTLNILKGEFNLIQFNEEFFRTFDDNRKGNENNIIVILIESKTILEGNYKKIVFNEVMKLFNSEIQSVDNPSIRVFETSDIENIGMEKLKYYFQSKNINLTKILTIKSSEIFKK